MNSFAKIAAAASISLLPSPSVSQSFEVIFTDGGLKCLNENSEVYDDLLRDEGSLFFNMEHCPDASNPFKKTSENMGEAPDLNLSNEDETPHRFISLSKESWECLKSLNAVPSANLIRFVHANGTCKFLAIGNE